MSGLIRLGIGVGGGIPEFLTFGLGIAIVPDRVELVDVGIAVAELAAAGVGVASLAAGAVATASLTGAVGVAALDEAAIGTSTLTGLQVEV